MKNIIVPKSEKDILDISVENRLFIFWQSSGVNPIPGYLSLCLETLVRFNPDVSLLFVNYDNIPVLVGDGIDLQRFVNLSLPMQSDILCAYFIYNYGGTFVDVDMIYTGKFDLSTNGDTDTLSMFGDPGNFVHLAFFHTHKPRNFLLWYIYQMQKYKLSLLPIDRAANLNWDYLGNSIIDPIVKETATNPSAPRLNVIPNDTVILEDKFHIPTYGPNTYAEFYFSKPTALPIETIIAKARHNIIFLHNSWTPRQYLTMTASEFIKCDITISKIFRYLLGTDTIKDDDLIQIPIAKNTTMGASASSKAIPSIAQSKVGRNVLCPCGSGKKYKRCCGI